MLLRHVTP